MIQEETLRKVDEQRYEDPEGQFLAHINTGTNTVTVLTEVNTEKAAVESSPVDPDNLTVAELNEALEDSDYQWNDAALRGLLDAETDGKDRATAVTAITDKLE